MWPLSKLASILEIKVGDVAKRTSRQRTRSGGQTNLGDGAGSCHTGGPLAVSADALLPVNAPLIPASNVASGSTPGDPL